MSEISQFLRNLLSQGDNSRQIFHEKFEDYHSFCGYLTEHFKRSNNVHVGSESRARNATDPHAYFQALFVACWITKPVEKGTYFLRMNPGLSREIKPLFDQLSGRPSSHLDGRGRSAHKGFAFLRGYSELLVQWMPTDGDRTYLMLKAEGNTTGLDGIWPHMKSWWNKHKTGAGLVANPDLNTLANEDNPISPRSAENFSQEYKNFLKSLSTQVGRKMQKPVTTVHDMLVVLTGEASLATASNKDVTAKLKQLIDGPDIVNGISLTNEIKEQFQRFVELNNIEKRHDSSYRRYFEEIHLSPADLDYGVNEFLNEDMGTSLSAQTVTRAKLLAGWNRGV